MTEEMITLHPGDIVLVKPYKVQSMNGVWSEAYMCGKTCWVVELFNDFDRRYRDNLYVGKPDTARVVYMPDNTYEVEHYANEKLSNLELVERGKDRAPLIGIDTSLPDGYERLSVFGDWLYRLKRLDQTCEGFTNSATYLADLYLRNDKGALRAVRQARRNDGSVNPNKVRKIFSDFKLKVDDWALEIPLAVPDIIKGWAWESRYKPTINWVEIAMNFDARFDT